MGNEVVRLEQWSVVGSPQDSHLAPEIRPRMLQGKAYGHPRFPDGREITTSVIISADGRVVTCSSRKYCLGEMSPGYADYLKQNGISIDPNNPIKIHNL